jgi:predicted transposase/invertase (TIGR01784 family)
MVKKLNVKNDIVFKLFFLEEENRPLLISFLESVLTLDSPIKKVKILNPSLPKEEIAEKASVLDLLVELKNKTKIDIEMQMNDTDFFRSRILYYWANLHHGQLKTGNIYGFIKPTISICILNYTEFEENPDEVHSIFELREINKGFSYNQDLQLHFLELPKYELWQKKQLQNQSLMEHWIQFFKYSDRETTDRHIIEMAKDPIMSKALKALEKLSSDPTAQELADMREKSRINLMLIKGAAY